jgi:environmental stress-induced protein Ves
MRIVRSGSLVPAPWKNGGGLTRTIATSPAGSAMDAFDWRLSMATVERAGVFSIFPGIDRILQILEGDGMELRFEDGRRASLMRGERIAFAGEDRIEASLAGGAVTDLNIMTRRSALRSEVREVEIDSHASLELPWAEAVLFILSGEALLPDLGGEALGARDAVAFDRGHAGMVRHSGAAKALAIGFDPAGRAKTIG